MAELRQFEDDHGLKSLLKLKVYPVPARRGTYYTQTSTGIICSVVEKSTYDKHQPLLVWRMALENDRKKSKVFPHNLKKIGWHQSPYVCTQFVSNTVNCFP
jgi:hypothetical protein